ncbi:unnamed protein product [Cylicostephanus goldi]|uniref:Uncharacterized protein n=1 Tax=Cylicostephanus goldi TaxID=71465 RepID=A0A3P7RA36_CYLGO|nr:unnamed protein product [Cylicostephanus goldi]
MIMISHRMVPASKCINLRVNEICRGIANEVEVVLETKPEIEDGWFSYIALDLSGYIVLVLEADLVTDAGDQASGELCQELTLC